MTDIGERLHTIRDHLRTGRFGQREVWEEWLTEAAEETERLGVVEELLNITKDEIERLNKDGAELAAIIRQQGFEIERLRAALEKIANGTWNVGVYSTTPCDARQFARRALEPKP
jgi:predicted nuclease with TOPRIM domain